MCVDEILAQLFQYCGDKNVADGYIVMKDINVRTNNLTDNNN